MIKKFLEKFPQSFIQTFSDVKGVKPELVKTLPMSSFEESKSLLIELNRAGAGIFFTPNPCEGGRTADKVVKIEWVYVDMDVGTKEEMKKRIKESPIQPDLIIESQRSYHCYWRADLDKADFDLIIGGLIRFFRGDPAISSINEVLRFPTFFHMKDPARPFEVKILLMKDTMHTAEALRKAFPYERPVAEKRAINTSYKDVKDIPVLYVLESLGIEVRGGFIMEDGVQTSAHILPNANAVKRFSDKPGTGSNIDVAMVYGKMTQWNAIKYLQKLGNIPDSTLTKPPEVDPIDEDSPPFTWGTPELDKKVSPLHNDTFCIFAGESGTGKTQYCFDIAIKNASLGHRVMFISLEMSTEAIYTRVAMGHAGINKEQWRDKKMIREGQRNSYKRKKEELKGNKNLVPIGFSDGVHPTLDRMESVIRESLPNLVIIDNFDLIAQDSSLSTYDNETTIAKRLMNLSKKLPMPIVVIHHLKKGDDNDLKKPRNMNSVRGSGKITHDADMVIIGHRKPYAEGQTREDLAEFTISQIKDRDFGIGCHQVVYFDKGSFYDRLPSTYDYAIDAFGGN